MMKLLQEKEPDEEDEFYNLIFAEKSSDEEFNPSQTEFSEDSQNSFVDEEEKNSKDKESESIEEIENRKENSSSEKNGMRKNKSRPKIKLRKKEILPRESKRRENRKDIEDIADIDLLDIDKIDEIEEMKEKGIYQEEFSDEDFSDEEEEEESFKKQKNKSKGISKKKTSLTEKKNKFLLDEEPESKKYYKKAFIDDETEEIFTKKRLRSTTQKFKKKPIKKKKLKLQANPNIIFNRRDPDTLIIRKVIFEEEGDEESFEPENENDIMEYNDEFFRDQENRNIQNEEENKQIIKKFKKPEKGQEGHVAVKYNFMQEKLSQKDLLIEAIFTEYYNIQSLQEMQRLEDLNKKEIPTQGRREFAEYVRIVKRVTKEASPEDKRIMEVDKSEGPEISKKTQEEMPNGEINRENDITRMLDYKEEKLKYKENEELEKKEDKHISRQNIKDSAGKHNLFYNYLDGVLKLDSKILTPEHAEVHKINKDFNIGPTDEEKNFHPATLPLYTKNENIFNHADNYVTFSNPLVFEKIFENFNKKSEIKEIRSCAITGLPAKYYDPLTKQYYSNIESFKILRERYFQKEEDSLLFRIQTLSDFASQKKEKVKKLILSNENGTSEASKNLLNMVNRIGILRNDNEYFDKKIISRN